MLREHSTYFKSIIFIFALIPFVSWSQLPATNTSKVGYKNEMYGSAMMHTNGFGASFYYAKFKTYKKKMMLHADFVTMKNLKEVKSQGLYDEQAKDFVYGKLNGLGILRIGYGGKTMLFDKIRENGVLISWGWSIGPSLGFLKPVYLDIVRFNADGSRRISEERYNPEEHNIGNIYGKSRGIKGLTELSIQPGIFFKTGISFDYTDERDLVRSLEVGVALDGFIERVPIMTAIDNPFLYPTVYLSFNFGKRSF